MPATPTSSARVAQTRGAILGGRLRANCNLKLQTGQAPDPLSPWGEPPDCKLCTMRKAGIGAGNRVAAKTVAKPGIGGVCGEGPDRKTPAKWFHASSYILICLVAAAMLFSHPLLDTFQPLVPRTLAPNLHHIRTNIRVLSPPQVRGTGHGMFAIIPRGRDVSWACRCLARHLDSTRFTV